MKLDLNNWKLLDAANAVVEGELKLKLAEPGTVYLTSEETGEEILLGYGHTFNARFNGAYKVEANKQAYIYVMPQKAMQTKDKVFTSMDMRGKVDGNQAAVESAVRLMRIENNAFLEAIKREQKRKKSDGLQVQDETPKKRKKADEKPADEEDEKNDEKKVLDEQKD